jgi:hypothetical protein
METLKDGENLADLGVDVRAILCRNESYIYTVQI